MEREQGTVPFLLDVRLRELIPAYPDAALCVALSGGVDSVALLHAAWRLARDEPRLRLRAIHVDHGLQPPSLRWADQVASICATLGVPLDVLRLGLRVDEGLSIEAEARTARYAALEAALAPGEYLLTGHHADDQLETVLLQLLRGAGVKGLAAMPRAAPLGAAVHLRPWLDVTRRELEAYAGSAGLAWIDDPMNAESRYDRAHLRHRVLPAIRERWPAAARTVGRGARHLAEAQGLLEDLASVDVAGLIDGARLDVQGLTRLPRPRQINVLRWWISGRGLRLPSTARLESILRDVVPARRDARAVVTWGGGEVRRYRGRLYAMRPLGPLPGRWQGELRSGAEGLELPCGLGRLTLTASPHRLGDDETWHVWFGIVEGSRVAGGRGAQPALRELFRQQRVVPWMRSRLPLVGRDGVLHSIPGLWSQQFSGAVAATDRPLARWTGGPSLF